MLSVCAFWRSKPTTNDVSNKCWSLAPLIGNISIPGGLSFGSPPKSAFFSPETVTWRQFLEVFIRDDIPKKNHRIVFHPINTLVNWLIIIPSLKLTFSHLKDGWLEDDRFLLGWLIFRCEHLSFRECNTYWGVVIPTPRSWVLDIGKNTVDR